MINQSSLKIKLLTNYHILEFFVCQQNYPSDCCQTTSIQYKTVHFYFLVGWWIVWQVVLVSVLHCQWARQTEPLLKCQTNRSQVKAQHLVSATRLSGKLNICTSLSGKLSIWKTECVYFCLIVICEHQFLGFHFLVISRNQMLMKARYLTIYLIDCTFVHKCTYPQNCEI